MLPDWLKKYMGAKQDVKDMGSGGISSIYPPRFPSSPPSFAIRQPSSETTPAPLVTYLQGISCGKPSSFEGLTVYPLFSESRHSDDLEYLLLEEALETGGLQLEELDEQGMVSYVKAANSLSRSVLILDGQELEGAKQNRIANASYFVAPKDTRFLRVSCIEQGRWSYQGKQFRSGHSIFAAGARRNKHRAVTDTLQTTHHFTGDQKQIWENVRHYIKKSGTQTTTDNYSAHVTTRKEKIAAFEEAIPYRAEQIGQVVFLHNQFLALDCLDQASKMKACFSKFLCSYAQEALDPIEEGASPSPSSLDERAGERIVERLWQMVGMQYLSLGEGIDLRFHDDDLMGSALVVEGRFLHLQVFSTKETNISL